jgi:hypothetical protein
LKTNVPDMTCFRSLVCIGNSSGTHIIVLIVRVPRWEEANSLSTRGAFYSTILDWNSKKMLPGLGLPGQVLFGSLGCDRHIFRLFVDPFGWVELGPVKATSVANLTW